MKVIFWGTRGSLPAPLRGTSVRRKLVNALVKGAGKGLDTPEKAEAFCDAELSFAEHSTFGGNTSCVQIDTGAADYLVCDLGSGVREFSLAALGRHGPAKPQVYNILVSHVHWDHIMGFPFSSRPSFPATPSASTAATRTSSPPFATRTTPVLSGGVHRPGGEDRVHHARDWRSL